MAERQADTSRDKMVGLEKNKNNSPHPSPTQKQGGRQMRWSRIKNVKGKGGGRGGRQWKDEAMRLKRGGETWDSG